MAPHLLEDERMAVSINKRVVFTVTNELTYDQRMIRIGTCLARNGYDVLLIGRNLKNAPPLSPAVFRQERISCIFNKGFLFYVEYNLRLFIRLLFLGTDIIGAIDLDTILPCLLAARIKKVHRIYDAHELFCEMKEISGRPIVYRIWKFIERHTVPHFPLGYTVNRPIAEELERLYRVKYDIVRNVPFEDASPPVPAEQKKEKYLIYQGSVNEGRSFETLIPAMKYVDAPLLIFGDGNFMEQTRELVRKHALDAKVIFKGKVVPDALHKYTRQAWAGITLFDAEGRSNYFSLANRFFDYVQAGIPQLCVDFPVYREMTAIYPVALLTRDLSAENLAKPLNALLSDTELYEQLSKACLEARKKWNWAMEEKQLLDFYKSHFNNH